MSEKFFDFEKLICVWSTFILMTACSGPSQSSLTGLAGATSTSTTIVATPTPATFGAAASISIFGGNNQNGIVGSVLSNPLSVRVTDALGVPVPGISVSFTVTSGGGSITTTTPILTDVTGIATASARLGAIVGTQTYTASMPSGITLSTIFSMSALATPSYLKIVPLAGITPIPATGYFVGDTAQYRAVLVDSLGALLQEIPATWTTSGTLAPADVAITGGNPSKYATYTPNSIGSGMIQVMVTDSTLISTNNIISAVATTGTLTITLPLIPSAISIFSGNLQTGQVGSPLGLPLVAKVVNSVGAAVPGANVTFAPLSGGGSISTSQPAVTDSNGYATTNVHLGGLIGNGHSFTATVSVGGNPTQVLFTATATAGPSARLSWATSPSGASSGTAFATQPVIQVQDSYGNIAISDSSTNVTVARLTGTGTLSGATTVQASAGIVTFTNLSYDTTENGVVLQATAAGLTAGNSSAFNVGATIIQAQCAADGNGWITTGGGCQDITSGLIWSASTTAVGVPNMTWGAAVWDSNVSGSAPESWETALGYTSDISTIVDTNRIDTGLLGGGPDNNYASYCHSLTESGLTDWRMPSYSDFNSAFQHGSTTAMKDADNNFWTSNPLGGGNEYSYAYYFDLSTGSNSWNTFVNTYPVRCVRRSPATQLVSASNPSTSSNGLGVNVPFQIPPKIKVADSSGSAYVNSTAPVTLTVTTGTGNLCISSPSTGVVSGCATSITVNAVAGVATFTNITYSKAESGVVLTATSTGLSSAVVPAFTVNQNYPLAQCKAIGSGWINARAGCKDTSSGLIYSSASTVTMNWYSAIWDSISVIGNNGTQDIYDNGLTNDYDPDPNNSQAPNPDASTVNYCHSLQESGKQDWFLPPLGYDAYTSDQNRQMSTYSNLASSVYYWTSTELTVANYGSYIPSYKIMSGFTLAPSHTNDLNNELHKTFCVRRDAAAGLAFFTQPAYAASCGDGIGGTINNTSGNGLPCSGAGVRFGIQPVVKVLDADGAGPLYGDTSMVTVTVVAASDGSGGHGRLLQYGLATANQDNKVIVARKSVSVQAIGGIATFANLAYDTPGEKFRLQISGSQTYEGTSNSYGAATPTYFSNDLQTGTTAIMSRCKNESGAWGTQNGGCQDLGASGLVWTFGAASSSWIDAVWDSTNGDVKVLASDGVTIETPTNDYDNSFGAGSGASGRDICQRLYVNGFYDWRMPTYAEMTNGLGNASHNGVANMRYTALGNYIWSAATAATTSNAYMMDGPGQGGDGSWYGQQAKSDNSRLVYCVRVPNASSLYVYPNTP